MGKKKLIVINRNMLRGLIAETADTGMDRFRQIGAHTGYRVTAPYEWSEEVEGGDSVSFAAAITDDYDNWIVGWDGHTAVLHTADDDIELTLDKLELLVSQFDLGELIEMSTDEIMQHAA